MRDKLSPSQAVRVQCTDCLGMKKFNRAEVEACKGDTCFTGPCALFPYRLGQRISVKVFRKFCLQCIGGRSDFIKDCPSISCKIYPYRTGKNPARQGVGKNSLRNARELTKIRQESFIGV